ncbi:MAG: DUF4868 domain-containing protein [Leptospirales bacterium]|nr:DUF4868 domain-containing protein [Leptospirales bacterium]
MIKEIKKTLDSSEAATIAVFLVFKQKRAKSEEQPGLPKHTLVARRINTSTDLQEAFVEVANSIVEHALSKDLALQKYSVIAADDPKLYTYDASSTASPIFSELKTQITRGSDDNRIKKTDEIDKSIWAYCVSIVKKGKRLDFFRKTSGSHVSTRSNSYLPKKVWAYFNVADETLDVTKESCVTFDRAFDFVAVGDQILIMNKSQFESILMLEDEFRERTLNLFQKLEQKEVIDGLDILKARSETSVSAMKHLARLVDTPDLTDISPQRLKAMVRVAKALKHNLKVKKGKLLIENTADADLIIKYLEDDFVKSMQSDQIYEASVKVALNPQSRKRKKK